MNRPNIVFILADDLGHWTLGCEGNQDAITPHIDRLAQEGMQLRRFYCASPVCSPARASLLTGMMPSRHGVSDWIRKGNVNSDTDQAITYLEGIKGYTEHLSEAGYDCALSGKWHLGDSQTPQQGFSHWYVHQRGGGWYFNAPMIKDGELVTEPDYLTHAITKDACGYIKSRKDTDKPFYLQVGYTAPHTPWVDSHPREYTDLYKDSAFSSCPVLPKHPDQVPYDQFADPRQKMLEGYFAATTAMDEGVGQIVQTLEEEGLLENTLVVFTSDNGFNCGHHGIWGKGNGTLPFNMYESSVKVPFIVRYPDKIKPGQLSQAVIGGYDWFPTILSLAGLEQTDISLPGKSFLPHLYGEDAAFNRQAYLYDEYGDTRMMISGDWKYIKRYPSGPDLLFHLGEDPNEEDNRLPLAPPDLVSALDQQMEDWFSRFTQKAADSRGAGVLGFGQDKRYEKDGFPQDSFCKDM